MKRCLTRTFLCIIFFLIIFCYFFFDIFVVVSTSMQPTIQKGDIVLVSTLYNIQIERNSIIAFKPIQGYFDKGFWTHRIVAINGDSVKIIGSQLYVNDKPTLYPNVRFSGQKHSYPNFILSENNKKVPYGYVFQKGDGALNGFGLVKVSDIYGRVIFNTDIPFVSP